MELAKLLEILDEISPFAAQEAWDNSGLQLGELGAQTGEIFTSLDLDTDLAQELPARCTLITHHPLIFRPLKRLDLSRYPAKTLKILVQKEINLIAMHTNYDKTHLNEFVAKNVLRWQDFTKQDFIIKTRKSTRLGDLLDELKTAFDLPVIKCVCTHESVETIGLTTGAGAGFISDSGVDTFLTGDLKYHDAILAKTLGINVIDITHYASEKFFANSLAAQLQIYNISATIRPLKDPLSYR